MLLGSIITNLFSLYSIILKDVKTYQQINANQENASFSISKMSDTFIKRGGKIDEPHRHNFYTVLVIKKAKGVHKIDFNAYDFSTHQVFFVAPGQVHQVMETEMSIGFAMTFSTQFLIENAIEISFIDSLNLFQNYGQTPPLALTENQFSSIEDFSMQIFDLFTGEKLLKQQAIGAYLKLLLIECNTICSINPIEIDVDISGDNLVRAFKKWVDTAFQEEHSTSYYASKLNITPDHLNRTIKSKIGKTAKEYIQSKIVIEAKRLLYFTELSNKEIGYALGFSEPANFSAFFKKQTTLSPSSFKKREQLS